MNRFKQLFRLYPIVVILSVLIMGYLSWSIVATHIPIILTITALIVYIVLLNKRKKSESQKDRP